MAKVLRSLQWWMSRAQAEEMAELPAAMERTPTMSMHSFFESLRVMDDNDAAAALALALNADQDIRRKLGKDARWDADAVRRVAIGLAAHSALEPDEQRRLNGREAEIMAWREHAAALETQVAELNAQLKTAEAINEVGAAAKSSLSQPALLQASVENAA